MTDNVAKIKDRLDVVDVLSGYIKTQKAGVNFKARCPFHNEKTPSFYISPERQIWHCFGCFPPGQKIKTPFGFHKIENIPEDHYVVSGKGLLRRVLATHKRNFEGNLVDIKVRKLGETVTLTEGHNVFVIRPRAEYLKNNKDFYRRYNKYLKYYINNPDKYFKNVKKYMPLLKISSGEVKKGDFALYPINNSIHDLECVNLKDYLTKKYTFGPRPPEIPYDIKVSDEFLKLIGYWIAEGSNHRAYIRFSLGNHEEDFAQEIVSLVKKVFNIDASIHRRSKYQHKTGLEITACHAYLADIFENLCSKGAENKHIPFIFQELPLEKQKVLLNAIFRGDGHGFIANRSTKVHKRITTISRVLAEQLVDILLRSDLYPSLRVGKEHIDKKSVHYREAYSVFWSEEAKSQHRCSYYQPDGTRYWLLPITDINKKNYQGPVYNLTVEKDHSYVATNFAVANCGKGGDMFSFVKQIEGVEFPEALRILAAKAGVEIDQHFDPVIKNEKNQLYKITETATRFFEKQLYESGYGKKAMDYLTDRGLTHDTIKEFRLGYAPNDWYSLSKFLLNCGFSKKEIADAGMAFLKEGRSDLYDRFRSRIIFPIFDVNGEVVGFTGRIFSAEGSPRSRESGAGGSVSGGEIAKYINTPQTQIYDKSRVLYGLHKAKTDIKVNNKCVLVEGNMDMLMSYQQGVRNVIASSGTALTPYHLKLLQRYTNNLCFCFDTDQAGAIATKRGIGLALKQNFNINIVSIDDKECKDPADYVKKYNSKWVEVVSRSKPVVEYYFDKATKEFDLGSPEGKKSAIFILAPFIKRLVSQVEKSHWVSQLAFLLRVGDDAIRADIELVKDDLDVYDRMDINTPSAIPIVSKTGPQITSFATGETMPDIYNENLLSVIIKNPSLFKEDLNDLPQEVHPLIKEVASKLAADQEFDFNNLIKNIEQQKAMQLEFAYLRSRELWKDFTDADLKEEFKNILEKIKQRAITIQLANIEFDIKEAEAAKDKGKISNLISRFNKLTEELSHLHKEF